MSGWKAAVAAGFVIIVLTTAVVFVIQNVADDKVVAAVLGLIGVVFTAAVTLVGLLFKDAADRRIADLAQQEQRIKEETEKRLQLEATQESRLRDEAERRLKLEASMRAVPLLSHDGNTASKHSVAGALFALTNLGYIDFALPLLHGLLQEANKVDPSTVMWLAERAMQETSRDDLHYQAATILEEHAAELGEAGLKQLPNPLSTDWNASYSRSVRIKLLSYLMDAHLASPPPEKSSDLQTLTIPLHSVIESDAELATNAARLLLPICEKICGHDKVHNHGPKELPLTIELKEHVRELADARTRASVTLRQKQDRLCEWLTRGGLQIEPAVHALDRRG